MTRFSFLITPFRGDNIPPRSKVHSSYIRRAFRIILTFTCLALCPSTILNAQVIISEILANNRSLERDNYGEYSDWLELHNPTTAPVSLWDWGLSDDQNNLKQWWIPNLILSPGESIRIWCSGRNDRNPKGSLHANFKLSSSGERIFLSRPNENVACFVLDYRNTQQSPNITFGCASSTYSSSLIKDSSPATYLLPRPGDSVPADWFKPQYDDTHWKQGYAPFGMDRQSTPTNASEIRTDLSMQVSAEAQRGLFRIPIQITQAQIDKTPELSIRFKDGIRCYLNGELIARRGVMKGNLWDPRAERFVASSEKGLMQEVQPPNFSRHLVPGLNLLAIELTFGEGKSIDFHLSPSIVTKPELPIETTENVFLIRSTPGKRNSEGFSTISPQPEHSERASIIARPSSLALTLPPETKGTIHYTLDGSEPSQASSKYEHPIPLSSSAQVAARTFSEQALPSHVSKSTFTYLATDSKRFSSNLPIVLIDTHGDRIGTSAYTSAALHVIAPETGGRARLLSPTEYSGDCGIKLRGSSTLNRPKKSFRIELRTTNGEEKSSPLLGMPSDGDWILYGPYNHNKTLINNVLVYELSRQMGHYAPRTRFVETFVKEHAGPLSMTSYVGLYVLMEKLEQSKNRVSIDKPGQGGADLSGGYIFKIDRRGPDEKGFRAGMQDLVHVDPDEKKISTEQAHWLTQYIERFFAALAGPDFTNSLSGYAAYLDVESFIDHRIIQELTRNPDAYSLSTYFTKPRGEKLRAGPVWDFDRAFYFGADLMERGYYERWMTWSEELGYNWDKLLMDDPKYRARLRVRGLEVIDGVWSVENVHRLIDTFADEIQEAQERNYQRWGHLSPSEWKDWIGYQKRYIARRLFWIRNHFLPVPTVTETPTQNGSTIELETNYAGASIFYTRDSDSPASEDGQITKEAIRYSEPIRVAKGQSISAAIKVGEHWSQPIVFTHQASQPQLAITEIMYHPENQSNLEFIEIQNIGSTIASLEGLEISDTIDFEFSDSQITQLAPGEVGLIVQDLPAFKKAYDTSTLKILGEYEDKLSNTSGRIQIQGQKGESIVDVFYSDAWYSETDSRGHSLNLNPDRIMGRDRWRDPRAWHPSPAPGGTPGIVPKNWKYWR